MYFERIGLKIPNILLPKQGTEMEKWAVIACDQYTSDPAYWQRVKDQTAGSISTLNLIYPEVYLDDPDGDLRIEAINRTMESYLTDGSLEEQPAGFILVDRKTSVVESRKGLIVALDLEQYDYTSGGQSLIRSTEGTILDRLPPRIKVRQHAPIELPHIMVLIDDPEKTVIEPLFNEKLETVYDFDLLENGGHLRGYRVDRLELMSQVTGALEQLADPATYRDKYQVDGEVMLYAMGDGNHSFATAKAIWSKLKEEADDPAQIMDHPARFALVELVNIHDAGLEFEAIHRVLFNVNCVYLRQQMEAFFAARNTPFSFSFCADLAEAEAAAVDQANCHAFPIILGGRFGVCRVAKPEYLLTVATLQAFLDDYLEANPTARIDYIHGKEAVTGLCGEPGCVGFYLPAISKHDLFKTIVLDGALPRKTFSMGEADEKRFYLECRKIQK